MGKMVGVRIVFVDRYVLSSNIYLIPKCEFLWCEICAVVWILVIIFIPGFEK